MVSVRESAALREVAGQILVNIQPGQSQTFQWGIISDEGTPDTLQLNATGDGSDFLSFPKSVTVQPHQTLLINITATIPPDFAGNLTLVPELTATQGGQQGGQTVINLGLGKLVNLVIGPNSNPIYMESGSQANLKMYSIPINLGNGTTQLIVESSSEVTGLNFDQSNKRISFNVTGAYGTQGTSVVHVGNILQGPYTVTFDGTPITDFGLLTNQATGETSIQITYHHSTHTIVITGTNVIPEFQLPAAIIVISMIGSIVILRRTKLFAP
jgi:hypothetical protein